VTLVEDVERFVADEVLPSVGAWDREDELPAGATRRLRELGLHGAMVPARYGGAGLTVTELVPVWRALSRGWISLAGAVNPSGLATALLVRHGTEDQRERWLPALAAGGATASFSITEPQAGSDLGRLETTAAPLDGGGFAIDGRKRWIAGGASSDVIFMMAETPSPPAPAKPSCIVLPADGRGSATWALEELDKVGYRGVESAAYRFTQHPAPDAEILGGPDQEGRGAAQMLDALDVGRVNVACRALGILDRALAAAVEESTEREVGDGLLGEHTHAQLRLGEIRVRLLAAEALTRHAAAAVDAREPAARTLPTAAKLFASEAAVWAVDQASRLAASRSYAAGDELARLRRDAPQTQIGEGANDALLLALAAPQLQTPVR
jgi:alkylation response protein AidB-like acyl-CoA dehydrogenase